MVSMVNAYTVLFIIIMQTVYTNKKNIYDENETIKDTNL